MAQLNGKEILFSAKVNIIGGGGDTEAAYNEGVEAGKHAEYDRFWDAFQINGTRQTYSYAFAGSGWTKEILKPKYPIKFPVEANASERRCLGMFSNFNRDYPVTKEFDLAEICSMIDFSGCKSANFTFQNAKAINVTCDFSKAALYQTFSCNDGGEIDNITLKVSENTTFSGTFNNASRTFTLIFTEDSVIAQNGLNLQWSTGLTHESLMSIITALQDKSADTSGTTWKVTIGSTNINKLTTAELNIAYNKGWVID